MSSFSIPKNTEDPLASTSATTEYPLDHLVNFRGNSDDNFRIGIKITRKAWRVVMMPANEDKLMECDIIIASPLGIKMQSEREESTDLLSSIEVAVVDGIDVMQMQNWDHVQVSPPVHTFSPDADDSSYSPTSTKCPNHLTGVISPESRTGT
jgi:U3 small nucleolar RNA-associated protein 25